MFRIRVVIPCLLFFALSGLAAEKTPQFEVTVPTRFTVDEQIVLAREYASQAVRARSDEERTQHRLAAISAWEVVAKRSHSDLASFMLARLSQADLWLDLRAGSNAVDVLNSVLPVATAAQNEAAVYRRLGNAFELLDRGDDAEKAFAKAESDPAIHREPRIALMALTDSARFFERSQRPTEAAKRYARLSKMRHVSPGSRATAALSAARTSIHGKDKVSARLFVGDAEALIAESRRGGATPEVIATLERELERIREASK
jgi:lysyl-tRNA synthetase class I